MGFTYWGAFKLPIWQRIWFIQRLNTEFSKANKEQQAATRAAHHNTPDMRAMQGRHHPQAPARLRRFT